MRAILLAVLLVGSAIALAAPVQAARACTSLADASCPSLVCAEPGVRHLGAVCADVAHPLVEVDLTWMTACPGPWGHRESRDVGPVRVTTYACDDGSV